LKVVSDEFNFAATFLNLKTESHSFQAVSYQKQSEKKISLRLLHKK